MEDKQTKKPSEYIHEIQRLQSFKNWPFDESHTCAAQKMAEAGFFFCGSNKEPDLVQCFLCLKKLDGWEPEDDPWKEHHNHASDCLFVKFGKKESELTYLELYKISREIAVNMLETEHAEFRARLKEEFDKTKTMIKKNKK